MLKPTYLTPAQASWLDCLYRAINRRKIERMWTPNAADISAYGAQLFPQLPPPDTSEIERFVRSSEAADLVRREPLPNVLSSLNEAVLSLESYSLLHGHLATIQLMDY